MATLNPIVLKHQVIRASATWRRNQVYQHISTTDLEGIARTFRIANAHAARNLTDPHGDIKHTPDYIIGSDWSSEPATKAPDHITDEYFRSGLQAK
jgi:hypothetical protein